MLNYCFKLISKLFALAVVLALIAPMFRSSVLAGELLPNKVLWAWQRNENLESIDVREFGVAYFACRILLTGRTSKTFWRDQSLKVLPGTKMVPVLRIDTDSHCKPDLSDSQIEQIIQVLKQMERLAQTAEIQIDFDAVQTERDFYRKLLEKIRAEMHLAVPLSITALASWCVFDNWIKDLPVDEEVPMMFSLGRDRAKMLLYFTQKQDFRVEKCFHSLGLSLEDSEVNKVMIPLVKQRKIPVRVFLFSRTAWNAKKIEAVRILLRDL